MTDQRSAELADGLAAVRQRIENAAAAAGRDPGGVTLIVVTKFFPVTDLVTLADLGVTDIGESRDQEATEKMSAWPEVADRRPRPRVHFIGRLQTNKTASVARYADVVHSVDRDRLVDRLSAGADRAGRRLQVLVQVSLDDDSSRGGVTGDQAASLADAVAAAPGLDLRGLMAIPPLAADPAESYRRLRDLCDAVRRAHPEATWMSAGMSADLEQAVAAGATHLRVGSAILGSRPARR